MMSVTNAPRWDALLTGCSWVRGFSASRTGVRPKVGLAAEAGSSIADPTPPDLRGVRYKGIGACNATSFERQRDLGLEADAGVEMTLDRRPRLARALTQATARQALVAAVRRLRYEVIPTVRAEEEVLAHVPRAIKVTVTASPVKGLDPTLNLTERLVRHGFEVVPHLSARMVVDEAHLRQILHRIAATGLREVFVIAGDRAQPLGKFAGAMDLLTAMAAIGHELPEVGVSGYPERHPFIHDDVTIQAMRDKRRIATYIVSNLCFDPKVITAWVRRVRQRGVELPIYIGLPGITDPARLLRISRKIGVGESARFLRGHRGWLRRMIEPGGFSPDRLMLGVAPALAKPDLKVAGFHIFTFNELEATEQWRRETLKRFGAAA